MNAMTETKAQRGVSGLDLLRAPFPAHQISKLPKPTSKQTAALNSDMNLGIRCKLCGGWHHKDTIHLDYVGHAALTDRLLDADPNWNWEPVTDNGLPKLDQNNGMWIRLTVCDVTRLGYGHAEGKKGGDAIKEVIGDALRNAAMRFGAALDLWHKGDLHADDEPEAPKPAANPAHVTRTPSGQPAPADQAKASLANADTLEQLSAIWLSLPRSLQVLPEVLGAKDNRKAALQSNPPITDDEIPY